MKPPARLLIASVLLLAALAPAAAGAADKSKAASKPPGSARATAAAPVAQESAGASRWYFAPFGGITSFNPKFGFYTKIDAGATVKNTFNAGGRLGWLAGNGLGFELAGGYSPAKIKNAATSESADLTFYHGSLNLIFEPSAGSWGGPFVSGGGGVQHLGLSSVSGGVTPLFSLGRIGTDTKSADLATADMAAGWAFTFGEKLGLRLEARNLLWVPKNRPDAAKLNTQVYGAALEFRFGGKPKDSDGDGVPDRKDKCPATPAGAKVDLTGCPMDTDHDGVFDGLDTCPGTPVGARVDAAGCPVDSDGDGVFDGLDKCEGTPRGATVDATGCPKDSDGDGVFDGLDKCEGTPRGATVDATGCPKDSDGDGVFDGLDKCAGTPAGAKVDVDGCPIEVTEKETELLDTGMIRLNNINFATGKADLLPEDLPTLDIVGQVMVKWPALQIEVGGHTDNRGSAALNQKLSEARAGAVLTYIIGKYPQLKAEQFAARGYGFSKPMVPNTNDLNRAKNRRVEFVVLNKDVLRKESEKRKLLQK